MPQGPLGPQYAGGDTGRRSIVEPLTQGERIEIAAALKREAQRLRGILADYNRAKGNLRNAAVKAMAEEGASNLLERAAALDTLHDKVLGIKPGDEPR